MKRKKLRYFYSSIKKRREVKEKAKQILNLSHISSIAGVKKRFVVDENLPSGYLGPTEANWLSSIYTL